MVTRNGDSLIMTTIQDKMTRHPRIRHIVIQPDSAKYGLGEFVNRIKSNAEDDHVSIDERIQDAFDDFSNYDEAIRKFGENLGDVIADTKNLVLERIHGNKKYEAESARFVTICKEILNDTIDQTSITNMLIQHIVTARIFAMVYDYEFYNTNSIARELERLRDILGISDDIIDYTDIKLVAESITDNESRQEFIRNIYETFYQKFDPKRASRDGIVYTPIEVVDFILYSVAHILESEFGTDFSDDSVKILDPFTGTGTFLARLLDSGLLGDNVQSKYCNDMFANELSLLAFYIATANLESTYHDIVQSDEYAPFEGMNYTDTLMMNPRYLEGKHHKYEQSKIDEQFVDIRKRRQKQRKTNLHIIVGNPPYSAGQSNYNDQNQNVEYPEIRKRIEDTYLEKTKTINPTIGLVRSLYDSYIQSIRWASDRIGESGIIGFVTNGSFIRSEAAVGLRACIQEEFTSVWVFDLRGNQRTQGEISRKEGGKVFGSGSRAPVAITILVKNPKKNRSGIIHYHDIGDFHSREKKLEIIRAAGSIKGIQDWCVIKPDKHNDWLNQRRDEFNDYLPMGSKDAKKGRGDAVFSIYSRGIGTSRDAWAYNSSKKELSKNMKCHIDYCKSQNWDNPIVDPKRVKWTPNLTRFLKRSKNLLFDQNKIRNSLYRPFFKQYLYFDKTFVETMVLVPKFFPKNDSKNKVIAVPYHADVEFSAIMTDVVPDIQINKNGQTFPLKIKKSDLRERSAQSVHNSAIQDSGRVLGVHNRHDAGSGGDTSWTDIPVSGEDEMMQDNITDYALSKYHKHYKDDTISKLDIFYYTYGILHHAGYRKKYANNLTRELPRIPMAPDFWPFCTIGRKLADLHLSWETCERYNLGRPKAKFGKYEKMDFARIKKDGKTVKDTKTLKINGIIVFENIPETKYRVNGRTPLEWAIDRYKIHVDKDSSITNDATKGLDGKPLDIVPLIERLVYVGVESDRLVSELPKEFEPSEWKPIKTGLDNFIKGPAQSRLV